MTFRCNRLVCIWQLLYVNTFFQGSSPYDLKAFAKQANAGSETSIISLNQLVISEPESD